MTDNLYGLENFQVIEPSAGTGNWLPYLPPDTWAYDIEPKHPDVVQADFLTLELFNTVKPMLFIGNPPFGRACSLAVKFFNHAAENGADVIAFILPKSFRKWSIINRLNPFFEKALDFELDVNYMNDKDEPICDVKNKLNTVYQIWERVSTKRDKIEIPDLGYIRKAPMDEANVAITLFGRKVGEVFDLSEVPAAKVKTTCNGFFYVRPDLLPLLSVLCYDRYAYNVSYTPALSIQEIRYLLNEMVA